MLFLSMDAAQFSCGGLGEWGISRGRRMDILVLRTSSEVPSLRYQAFNSAHRLDILVLECPWRSRSYGGITFASFQIEVIHYPASYPPQYVRIYLLARTL